MITVHLCPTCHQPVKPTRRQNIPGHLDNIGTICPSSYEPLYTTVQVIIDEQAAA